MCSFGQGVSLTPLQLGAFVAAIANGGTLYYLQHPTTPEEIASFQPRSSARSTLPSTFPNLQDGMAGAVEYGTARSLRANFHELPVFGKTGTCSDDGTRFGWFASFSDSPQGSLVTVFFLEGGRANLRPARRRADRRVLPESLGPQLLRRQEPGSAVNGRGNSRRTLASCLTASRTCSCYYTGCGKTRRGTSQKAL